MKITRYNFVIALIILFIIVSFSIIILPSKTYEQDTYEIINKSIIEDFSTSDYLEEEFVSKDNYNYVGIQVATYSTLVRKGKMIVTIINQNGKEKKYVIKVNSIIDNQEHYFKYKLKKNKKYKIRIENKNLSSPVTIITTDAKIKDAELSINGSSSDKNLVLSFIKSKKNYYNIWYCLLIIAVLSSYAIMIKENK